MRIEFGDWLPDLPENENPGALIAKNCIPLLKSYGSFKSLASFTPALAGGGARGMFWLRSAAAGSFNFAGDAANLYLYSGGGTWGNINKPATTYSADFWDFTNFQNRVVVTDGGAGAVQYYDIGVSATFDDLPGATALRAKVVGTLRDFLLMGNYQIGSEVEEGGLAWSGFNNTENWTPSLSTQSGRRRTRGAGGEVQRIVSGTEAIVFREQSIMLVNYIGPPNIMRVDDLTTGHGTPAPRSVCWTRDLVFYYSSEGFFQLDRSTRAMTPIGAFKVDDWFKANAAKSDISRMIGTVDRVRGLVFWAFRSSASSVPYDRILVFNWRSQRWAYAEIETEFLGEFAALGFNLDTIGAFLGGNIDSASINVDTDAFKGGDTSFVAFDSMHRTATFTGAALTAQFDTGEFRSDEIKRTYVRSARPIVQTVEADVPIEVAPLTRDRVADNPVTGPFVAVNAQGLADARVNARYQRYRVRISGEFDHATRVELVGAKLRGRR
jgi:hypothetical protein